MNGEFLKQDVNKLEADVATLKERVARLEVAMENLDGVLEKIEKKIDNHSQKLYWVLGVLAVVGSIAGTVIARIIFSFGMH
ncbi:MAG: hypothetical protein J7K20_01735 [Thermodesulfobacterium sp.]|nr:hypothetical protein [Thermodesulfobacterium sp.]